jgi:hypothetical protein
MVALFRLGFPEASARKALTEPLTVTRRIIMQKARRHPFPCGHRAPTACRHMVSGSHSSPNRGSSHLSVAILSSLSVIREYLALRDGPRRFSRDSTWPDLLRYSSRDCTAAAYGTVTLCGRSFQTRSASRQFCDSHVRSPTTPQGKPPRFGLFRFRSPLLTKSIFLSLPPGTEMFQFPGFAAYGYGFTVR